VATSYFRHGIWYFVLSSSLSIDEGRRGEKIWSGRVHRYLGGMNGHSTFDVRIECHQALRGWWDQLLARRWWRSLAKRMQHLSSCGGMTAGLPGLSSSLATIWTLKLEQRKRPGICLWWTAFEAQF
jgi:hypothetical protein